MRLTNFATTDVQYPMKAIFCDFFQHFLTVCDINGIYKFVNYTYIFTEEFGLMTNVWNLRL